MQDKLTLGLPDSEAATAPMNKYREKEERGGGKKKFILPIFALSAFGLMFSKTEPGQRNDTDEAAGENEEPAARDELDIVADVAAFLQELNRETAADETSEDASAVRLSFQTGSTVPPEDEPKPRTVRGGVIDPANDNLRGVVDNDDLFEFPQLRLPGSMIYPAKSPFAPPSLDLSDDEWPAWDMADDEDDRQAPMNRAPVSLGRYTLANGMMNLSALVLLDDLLARVYDPDGDQLSINDITVSSGQIRAYGDGVWLYTPQRGYVGNVTFSYDVSDGQTEIRTSALLNLMASAPREITGTEGDDTLLGTPGVDMIAGLAGNDTIYGRESDDIIRGDEGDDRLLGGDGNDLIHGGAGNDLLSGGKGNDVLFGEEGNDRLFGEDGNDILIAGLGDDELLGGNGNDRLFGEEGDDHLSGDAGDDYLDAGKGNDVLTGGGGNDVAVAGEGDDLFKAGFSGEEERTGAGTQHDGNDTYAGGEGFDTYDAASAQYAINIDLTQGLASGQDIGADRLDDIEAAIGGCGDDSLTGNDGANLLSGGEGDDILCAKDGNDTVFGDDGDDIVVVLARIDGDDDNDGDDHYSGGDGFDTLDFAALAREIVADLEQQLAEGRDIGSDRIDGFEAIIGGRASDRLYGDRENNILIGGEGNDRLTGRDGEDVLTGDDGDDTISGDDGNDVVLVAIHADDEARHGMDDGHDSYDGGDGIDTYNAAGAIRAVMIDLAAGRVTGADIGHDELEDFEAAIGGSGADVIVAGNTVNFLAGGEGDDVFVFRSLEALHNGGNGRDEIRDFTVGDRIDFSEFAGGIGGLIFGSSEGEGQPVNRITLYHENFEDGERTIVRAIIDFDRDEDFEILLYGRHELTEQDFILAALESAAQDTASR